MKSNKSRVSPSGWPIVLGHTDYLTIPYYKELVRFLTFLCFQFLDKLLSFRQQFDCGICTQFCSPFSLAVTELFSTRPEPCLSFSKIVLLDGAIPCSSYPPYNSPLTTASIRFTPVLKKFCWEDLHLGFLQRCTKLISDSCLPYHSQTSLSFKDFTSIQIIGIKRRFTCPSKGIDACLGTDT